MRRIKILAAVAASIASCPALGADEARDLTGLWAAEQRYGPDIRGPLLIHVTGTEWRADVAGFSVPISRSKEELSFELPDRKGRFRGERRGRDIVGQWVQAKTVSSGLEYAVPMTLRPDGRGRWRGEIMPLVDSFSYYLPVRRGANGSYAAYLRNPERNQGRFIPVTSLELKDEAVRLIGQRRGQKQDTSLAQGRYDAESDLLSISLRGTAFDFSRDETASSPFYPRGRTGERYRYRPPLAFDDGWPVGTLEEAKLDRAAIESFVQWLIDMPMENVSTTQIHGLLIARHGKLVLEEYFHGFDRTTPHDTRSAAKSLAATLVGAAMQSGVPIRLDTPVYATMYGDALPSGLDPAKRAMTLEHLLTMSGGHFCDDNNPDAPGNESTMLDQDKERDYYRYILALPMDRVPGEKPVYCSVDPHLAGGMLSRIGGERLPEMFRRLVAEPLQMGNYYLPLTPTGEGYMGGGARMVPRDFMKLAQLMVNGGTWRGRRVVSREWTQKATAPIKDLAGIQYGYLWWSMEHQFRDRKLRAFFAAGNGGQTFMGIPELDMVIAFTGGNYADPALLIPQRVLVPKYILPAVTN